MAFLVSLLMPVVLIVIGAAATGGGLYLGWSWMTLTGLVIIGVGVLWGVVLFFISSDGLL